MSIKQRVREYGFGDSLRLPDVRAAVRLTYTGGFDVLQKRKYEDLIPLPISMLGIL